MKCRARVGPTPFDRAIARARRRDDALSDARACDVAGVVRRVHEVFQADRAGSGDGEMVEIEFDADAAMACARALEAFRDALAGAAEQRRF